MKRISFLAVIVGGITDMGTTFVFSLLVSIYIMVKHDVMHLPKSEMAPTLTKLLHSDHVVYLSLILLGAMCSMLGGYVAGKVAKHDHVLNGLLSCLFCVSSGVYGLTHGSAMVEFVLEVPLSVGVAALGGYLSRPRPAQIPASL